MYISKIIQFNFMVYSFCMHSYLISFFLLFNVFVRIIVSFQIFLAGCSIRMSNYFLDLFIAITQSFAGIQVPGVPVIYGLRNSLFIEQPSAQQRQYAKSTEEKRLHMGESEYLKLYKSDLKGVITNDSTNRLTEGTQLTRNISTTKRMLGVAEKSKFKRKRAKVQFSDLQFSVLTSVTSDAGSLFLEYLAHSE